MFPNVPTPYRSERTEAWLKIKTVQKAKFPVVGFVKDPTGVAALYLGKREGNELVYVGKVGTGWSRTVIKSNSQTTGYCGELEVEAHEAHQEA